MKMTLAILAGLALAVSSASDLLNAGDASELSTAAMAQPPATTRYEGAMQPLKMRAPCINPPARVEDQLPGGR